MRVYHLDPTSVAMVLDNPDPTSAVTILDNLDHTVHMSL